MLSTIYTQICTIHILLWYYRADYASTYLNPIHIYCFYLRFWSNWCVRHWHYRCVWNLFKYRRRVRCYTSTYFTFIFLRTTTFAGSPIIKIKTNVYSCVSGYLPNYFKLGFFFYKFYRFKILIFDITSSPFITNTGITTE